MAVQNDDITKLYDALKKAGLSSKELAGSPEGFRTAMGDEKKRNKFYDWVKTSVPNFKIGPRESYNSRIQSALTAQEEPSSAPSQAIDTPAPISVDRQELPPIVAPQAPQSLGPTEPSKATTEPSKVTTEPSKVTTEPKSNAEVLSSAKFSNRFRRQAPIKDPVYLKPRYGKVEPGTIDQSIRKGKEKEERRQAKNSGTTVDYTEMLHGMGVPTLDEFDNEERAKITAPLTPNNPILHQVETAKDPERKALHNKMYGETQQTVGDAIDKLWGTTQEKADKTARGEGTVKFTEAGKFLMTPTGGMALGAKSARDYERSFNQVFPQVVDEVFKEAEGSDTISGGKTGTAVPKKEIVELANSLGITPKEYIDKYFMPKIQQQVFDKLVEKNMPTDKWDKALKEGLKNTIFGLIYEAPRVWDDPTQAAIEQKALESVKGNFGSDLTGTVISLVGDLPVFGLAEVPAGKVTSAIGNQVAKKFVAKGVEKTVAENLAKEAMKTGGLRIATGMASSATNLATFNAIHTLAGQLNQGKFDAAQVAEEAAKGGILGSVLGLTGAYTQKATRYLNNTFGKTFEGFGFGETLGRAVGEAAGRGASLELTTNVMAGLNALEMAVKGEDIDYGKLYDDAFIMNLGFGIIHSIKALSKMPAGTTAKSYLRALGSDGLMFSEDDIADLKDAGIEASSYYDLLKKLSTYGREEVGDPSLKGLGYSPDEGGADVRNKAMEEEFRSKYENSLADLLSNNNLTNEQRDKITYLLTGEHLTSSPETTYVGVHKEGNKFVVSGYATPDVVNFRRSFSTEKEANDFATRANNIAQSSSVREWMKGGLTAYMAEIDGFAGVVSKAIAEDGEDVDTLASDIADALRVFTINKEGLNSRQVRLLNRLKEVSDADEGFNMLMQEKLGKYDVSRLVDEVSDKYGLSREDVLKAANSRADFNSLKESNPDMHDALVELRESLADMLGYRERFEQAEFEREVDRTPSGTPTSKEMGENGGFWKAAREKYQSVKDAWNEFKGRFTRGDKTVQAYEQGANEGEEGVEVSQVVTENLRQQLVDNGMEAYAQELEKFINEYEGSRMPSEARELLDQMEGTPNGELLSRYADELMRAKGQQESSVINAGTELKSFLEEKEGAISPEGNVTLVTFRINNDGTEHETGILIGRTGNTVFLRMPERNTHIVSGALQMSTTSAHIDDVIKEWYGTPDVNPATTEGVVPTSPEGTEIPADETPATTGGAVEAPTPVVPPTHTPAPTPTERPTETEAPSPIEEPKAPTTPSVAFNGIKLDDKGDPLVDKEADPSKVADFYVNNPNRLPENIVDGLVGAKLEEARELFNQANSVEEPQPTAAGLADWQARHDEWQTNRDNAQTALQFWLDVQREIQNGRTRNSGPAVGEGEVPDVTFDTPEAAAERGYVLQNGHRIDRSPVHTDGMIVGNETEVIFNNGEGGKVKATYQLVPTSWLQPSHVNGQENLSRFAVRNGQPKNRDSVASERGIDGIKRNPDRRILDGTSAYEGAPVINTRGEIIQGNGRGEAIRRMQGTPSADTYRQMILDNPEQFGFTKEQVENMPEGYSLVRVADVDDSKFIELGQYTSADLESAGDQGLNPTAMSELLNSKGSVESFISTLLNDPEGDTSINGLIKANGFDALKIAASSGVISQTQFENAINGGKITDIARLQIESLLDELILGKSTDSTRKAYDSLPERMRNALLFAFAQDTNAPTSNRIMPEIRKALDLLGYVQSKNGASLKAATTYGEVIGAINGALSFVGDIADASIPKYSKFEKTLAGLFSSLKGREMQDKFSEYYELTEPNQEDLFGGGQSLTRNEAIEKVFGVKNEESVQPGNGSVVPPTDLSGNGGGTLSSGDRGSEQGISGEGGETLTGASEGVADGGLAPDGTLPTEPRITTTGYTEGDIEELVHDPNAIIDVNKTSLMRAGVHSIDDLKRIFDTLNGDEELKVLFDKVFETSKIIGLDKVYVNKKLGTGMSPIVAQYSLYPHGNGRGKYGHMITLGEEGFKRKVNNQEKASDVLHEMIHHVTLMAIDYARGIFPESWANLPENVKEGFLSGARDLNNIYETIKMDPAFFGMYGVHSNSNSNYKDLWRDGSEMVAELSNPKFRDALKEKDLWVQTVDAISKFFDHEVEGADKSDAYTETQKALNKCMDSWNGRYMAPVAKPEVNGVLTVEQIDSLDIDPLDAQLAKTYIEKLAEDPNFESEYLKGAYETALEAWNETRSNGMDEPIGTKEGEDSPTQKGDSDKFPTEKDNLGRDRTLYGENMFITDYSDKVYALFGVDNLVGSVSELEYNLLTAAIEKAGAFGGKYLMDTGVKGSDGKNIKEYPYMISKKQPEVLGKVKDILSLFLSNRKAFVNKYNRRDPLNMEVKAIEGYNEFRPKYNKNTTLIVGTENGDYYVFGKDIEKINALDGVKVDTTVLTDGTKIGTIEGNWRIPINRNIDFALVGQTYGEPFKEIEAKYFDKSGNSVTREEKEAETFKSEIEGADNEVMDILSQLDTLLNKGKDERNKVLESENDVYAYAEKIVDLRRQKVKDGKLIGELKTRLRLAVGKSGYGIIYEGQADASNWMEVMASKFGEPLKNVFGWDDDQLSQYLSDVRDYTKVANEKGEIKYLAEYLNEKSAENASENKNEFVLLPEHKNYIDAIANELTLAFTTTGEAPFKSIHDLRRLAKESGISLGENGKTDVLLNELAERAVIKVARQLIAEGKNRGLGDKDIYDDIVSLYEAQPLMRARNGESIDKQQYSTPIPISFMADMFAYREGETKNVLEPTSGNGMLVIGVPEEKVHVNEISPIRIAILKDQPFGKLTTEDATKPFTEGVKYDAIISNPPFGQGVSEKRGALTINGLDPVIAVRALDNLADNGRAAIVLGGHIKYASNGAVSGGKRDFLCYLYDNYNVKGVVDINGNLYSRQGTSFPIQMVLIDGRRSDADRQKSTIYPPVESKAIPVVNSFEELYNTVNDIINSENKTNGTEIVRDGRTDGVPTGDIGRTGVPGRGGLEGQSSSPIGEKLPGNGEGQTTEQGKQPTPMGERGDNKIPSGSVGGSSGSNRPGGNADNTSTEGGIHLGDAQAGAEPVERPATEKRELGQDKMSYVSHASGFNLEAVTPAYMAEAMDNALKELESRVGNIDNFVMNELGYTPEELGGLAALQRDAVALAIDKMKHGSGLIIGDQTGMGKGRQMAALIRWARRQGKRPIFITQKSGLFTDIYRDLVDIHSGDMKPFIFNSDSEAPMTIENEDGKLKKVYSPLSKEEQTKVFESGVLPEEYDYVVLTYSQVSSGDEQSATESNRKEPSKVTPKAKFLRSISKDNFLFLDESHTASGESNTGAYFQSLMRDVKGATFASATFAKRPDSMPLYAFNTALSGANIDAKDLINAIGVGGVALQEIMSRGLTDAGNYVRRERNMDGVITDWKTISDPVLVEKARKQYDKTIEAFNALVNFQNTFIEAAIAVQDNTRAAMAQNARAKRGTKKFGIDNNPIMSQTYNLTKQMMLALKTDAIVDEVIREIEAGHKPVIALENTMGSALDAFMPKGKKRVKGEKRPKFQPIPIQDSSFSSVLKRMLDNCLTYSIKQGKDVVETTTLDISDLGEEGMAEYYRLINEVIPSATEGLFISPLDEITSKLEEREYHVGELTGRTNKVIKIGEQYYVDKKGKPKKKQAAADFNNGRIDVLMVNKTGSTGISLHASSKFKDQRPRTMIIAQPLADINDYMQMIGRIDRTGQLFRGYYINLGLPIPAEYRFLMMLSTKLKSLNANTTSSQSNNGSDVEAIDMLNKYGSQIVAEYLKDNPDIYEKLGDPFDIEGSDDADLENYKPSTDDTDVRKITGRVALLSIKEQEDFYNDIAERYERLIKLLDDTGENDLKITTLPLRAKTIEKRIAAQGVNPDGDNPFAKDSYVEKVEMDVLKKPMTSEEVKKGIEAINEGDAEGHTNRLIEMENERYERKVAAENERYNKAMDKISKQEQEAYADENKSDEAKQAIFDKLDEGRTKVREKYELNQMKLRQAHNAFVQQMEYFNVGQAYIIPSNLEDQMGLNTTRGIFCGYKFNSKEIVPSKVEAVFATLDGRREVRVLLSRPQQAYNIHNLSYQNYDALRSTNLNTWDGERPTETRKEGYIMTGNILQAIVDTMDPETGIFTGQLVSYTDIDGNIHDGVLMPDGWRPGSLRSAGVPIGARESDIARLDKGESITSTDGHVTIKREGWSWNVLNLIIPSAKKNNNKFFNNDKFKKFFGELSSFDSYSGNRLAVSFSKDKLNEALTILSNLGVRVKDPNETTEERNKVFKKNNLGDAYADAEDILADVRNKDSGKGDAYEDAKEILSKKTNDDVTAPFKNNRGTVIKRGGTLNGEKHEIGKVIAGKLYVHKDYADAELPEGLLSKAEEILPNGFKYNTVCFDPKTPNVLRFDECPTFDSASNPVVGRQIKVDVEKGEVIGDRYEGQIFHDKWQWVGNDYKGFDVEKSYEWSKEYNSVLTVTPSGRADKWAKQLEDAGLTSPDKIRTSGSLGDAYADAEEIMADVRNKTAGQLDEEYPGWNEGSVKDSGGDNTQIPNTVGTYKKVGEWAMSNGLKDASILDASSGLGVGTKALREMGMTVDDVEPYPAGWDKDEQGNWFEKEKKTPKEIHREEPPTFKNYEDIDKQYDLVISNAVLNVIPDDWRENVMQQMAGVVKTGGKLFINTRSKPEALKTKNKIELDNEYELLVLNQDGSYKHYQKFSDVPELISWAKMQLGPNWKVEKATEKNIGFRNDCSIVCTKVSDAPKKYDKTDPYDMAEEIMADVRNKEYDTGASLASDPDVKVMRATLGTTRRDYDIRLAGEMHQQAEIWRDYAKSVKTAQELIEKEIGRKLLPSENAYEFENQMHSMSATGVDNFGRNFYDPLMKEVGLMCKAGEDLESIDDYLIAKSGLERNIVLRDRDVLAGKRVPKNKDYAGLTSLTGKKDLAEATVEAQRMVEEFEAEHDTTNLWKLINSATGHNLDQAYDSGMITDSTYEHIKSMMQYYVPLRGWDETIAEDVYSYENEMRKGVGSVIKSAKGRSSKAFSPLAYIGAMGEASVVQANKNRLMQHVLNLATNSRTDLLSVNKLYIQRDPITDEWHAIFPKLEDVDGKPLEGDDVKRVMDAFEKEMDEKVNNDPDNYALGHDKRGIPYKIGMKQLPAHQMVAYRNGRPYVITVNGNPRFAKALKGELSHSRYNGDIYKAVSSLTRSLSTLFTTYSPQFIINNPSRDFQTSLINNFVHEDAKFTGAFAAQWWKGLTTARINRLYRGYKNGTLDMSNPTHKYFKEFLENGGPTALAVAISPEASKARLDEIYFNATGKHVPRNMTEQDTHNFVKRWTNKILTGKDKVSETAHKSVVPKKVIAYFIENGHIELAEMLSKASVSGTIVPVELIGEALKTMNRDMEILTRFTTYLVSRQQGFTIQESVEKAKEITGNYNRHGAGKGLLDDPTASWVTRGSARFAQYSFATMPFLNAAIQSFYTTTFRNFEEDELILPDSTGGTEDGRKEATSAEKGKKKGSRKKKIEKFTIAVLGCAALGFLNRLLYGYLSEDDKQYDQIPEYERRSKLCLPIGGNEYIGVPLGYQYRSAWGIGDVLAEKLLSNGSRKSDNEYAMEITHQVVSAMPIYFLEGDTPGDDSNILKAVAIKTLVPGNTAKPLLGVAMNRKWNGYPVYSTSEHLKKAPEYMRGFKTTDPKLTELSKWLYETSRGKNLRDKGSIDINPASAEYLLESYLGGPYKEIARDIRFVNELIEPDTKVKKRNIPFVGNFFREIDDSRGDRRESNAWYEHRNQAERVETAMAGMSPEKLAQYRKSDEYKWYVYWHSNENTYNKWSRQYKNNPNDKLRKALDDLMLRMNQETEKMLGE